LSDIGTRRFCESDSGRKKKLRTNVMKQMTVTIWKDELSGSSLKMPKS